MWFGPRVCTPETTDDHLSVVLCRSLNGGCWGKRMRFIHKGGSKNSHLSLLRKRKERLPWLKPRDWLENGPSHHLLISSTWSH